MKKTNKINDYNILFINIQAILTIGIIVTFIVFLLHKSMLWLLLLFIGLDLLMLSYNNNKIYKREGFTGSYLVVGIIVIVVSILMLIGVI